MEQHLGTIGSPARDGSTVMDVVKYNGILYRIEVYKNRSTWIAFYEERSMKKLGGGDPNVMSAIKMWVKQPNFADLNANDFVHRVIG